MEKKLCRLLDIPVITRSGLGMTCDSKKQDPPPSSQVVAQALILPRTVRLCGDCSDKPPCTEHEPAYPVGSNFRIGW